MTRTDSILAVMHHAHHWLIEMPAGPTSWGKCSCGAIKLFRNGMTTYGDYEASRVPLATRGVRVG